MLRAVLWFMALFGVALAGALFFSANNGVVAVFWPPYRVDISLNLCLLLLVVIFLILHFALRALSALLGIAQQARHWRLLQKERAIQMSLLDALSYLVSGRFVRARKSAELLLSLEKSMMGSGGRLLYAQRLRTLAHLLVAESAHAVQDTAARERHLQHALEGTDGRAGQDIRDGLLLRAARWALHDRDAGLAMQCLDRLSQGAARRIVTLRLRFKAARLAGQSRQALESSRLLLKHRVFSQVVGRSVAQSLAIELIRGAHDQAQVQAVWNALDVFEQRIPEVALEASERFLLLGVERTQVRQCLLAVWEAMVASPDSFSLALRIKLVRVLSLSFDAAQAPVEVSWLARIEAAQAAWPQDALLQYLAGLVCMRLSLWGKAQQMIKQALPLLPDPELKREAWLAIATLAEQRQEIDVANQAYREAAKR